MRTCVTQPHIDSVYDAVETLALAGVVLSSGNISDRTAGSISWLLGSMGDKLSAIIDLLERIEAEQKKQRPVDNGD